MGLVSNLFTQALNTASTLYTNRVNRQMQREQNAFNSAEAEKQRQWETEMSNTAYQRGMADMKAAGINPLLGYSAGQASTPESAPAHSALGVHMTAPQFADFISQNQRDVVNTAVQILGLSRGEGSDRYSRNSIGFGR